MDAIHKPGIYKTSYGTLANYIAGSLAWDLRFRQWTSVDYLRERIRRAGKSEYPAYLADKGRDWVKERGIKWDRSGKLKRRVL